MNFLNSYLCAYILIPRKPEYDFHQIFERPSSRIGHTRGSWGPLLATMAIAWCGLGNLTQHGQT